MDGNKAPRPDDFQAAFFQRNWSIVGHDVTTACLKVLKDGASIEGWNDTFVCLIPKTKKPKKITELRLSSLCNAINMIVTKALANRLKKVLDRVISECQSAFLLGRLISDNVVIAFELMHPLRRRNMVVRAGLLLKLDMSKAYDRV